MQATAKVHYLRVAPRKTRLVADLIRGKAVQHALDILAFSQRRVARDLRKLLRSALANAEATGKMDVDQLVIKKICVDQGPILKRWLQRAKGSADQIQKKTSHVTLVLEEK